MRHKDTPTQQRLLELLDYSIITGELRWKVNRNHNSKAGDLAGPNSSNNRGYLAICIDNQRYLQHRIIWKMVTGSELNEHQVDHINGDRSNNSWHNLRVADASQNRANSIYRGSSCGVKGVYRVNSSSSKFRSQIKMYGKQVHLGTFPTIELASEAYVKAAAELHREFSRTV